MSSGQRDDAPTDTGPARTGQQALEELRDRVEELSGDVAELTAAARRATGHDAFTALREELFADPVEGSEQPAGAITDLQRVCDQLAHELEDVREQQEARTPILPNWAEMDQSTAEVAWRNLVDWLLGVFVVRYPSSAEALQPCWFHHPEVVENLSWLHNAWTVAYRDAGSPVALAADWHTAWLPHVVTVMRSEFRPCYTNQIHNTTQRRNLLNDNVVGLGVDLDEHEAADLRNRVARDADVDRPHYVPTPPPMPPRAWAQTRSRRTTDGPGAPRGPRA